MNGRWKQVVVIAVTLLLLVAGCSPSAAALPPTPIPLTPTPDTVKLTQDVAYTSERKLDVYTPKKPGAWPVVIVLPGGGDPKESLVDLSRGIAEQGAVVFTPDYRSNAPLPPKEDIAGGNKDAACAIRFARAKASEYGGNPSRVIVVGYSAGGTFGATMALAGDDFEGDCQVSGVSAYPDAFVGLDGAYDIIKEIPEYYYQLASPEEWKVMSPFTYVNRQPIRKDVKFYIMVGYTPVLIEYAQKFHEALKAAGYTTTLTQLPGVGHTQIPDPKREEVMRTIVEAMQP